MANPRELRPRPPLVIVVLGALAVAYLVLPIMALATRVPWGRLVEILTRPEVAELIGLTLSAAVASSAIVVLIGVPLALAIQSLRRGAHIARLLVLLPLAMPPVVGGLALSALIGNNGILAGALDVLNLQFAFAFPGVVAAHVFVALPFVVVAVDSALRQIDSEVTASAAGIGMSPAEVLRKITLPTIRPAIATGAGLAFARSLGEFGTTITFAGSMPGITRTMSLAIYLERETDRDAAYALSAVLIALAVIVLALAFVPTLLHRSPTPVARTLADMDTARLRTLTVPEEPAAITARADATTTAFPAGSTTAVIGPNGSGKSTLSGMIAGRLTGAEVSVDEVRVDALPAHRRGIVLLTQNPGLPRVGTVLDILTMVTRDQRRSDQLLDAAGLHPLRDVPVASLSGGQAAQVALLRALASRPRALILDEPLAAIDVHSSARWRALLRATADDRTTVLVTHDLLDIAGLSDRIVALEAGVPVAAGPTQEMLEVPPNDFVAGLAGINRLAGTVTAVNADTVTVEASGVELIGLPTAGSALSEGDSVVATVLPEAITLRLASGGEKVPTSARNHWVGEVTDVQAGSASATTVVVGLGERLVRASVTTAAVVELGLAPKSRVELVTKAQAITIHPRP